MTEHSSPHVCSCSLLDRVYSQAAGYTYWHKEKKQTVETDRVSNDVTILSFAMTVMNDHYSFESREIKSRLSVTMDSLMDDERTHKSKRIAWSFVKQRIESGFFYEVKKKLK